MVTPSKGNKNKKLGSARKMSMMPSHGTDKAFFNAIDVIEHLGKNTANRRRESDNLMNKSMTNNDKEVD